MTLSKGFGIVYKGEYEGKEVAIKELKLASKEDQVEKFRDFQQEVYIMSKLKHLNIVSLYGITLDPLQMVIEFCPLPDLHALFNHHQHLIPDNVYTPKLQLQFILDIAKGMRFLESQNPPIGFYFFFIASFFNLFFEFLFTTLISAQRPEKSKCIFSF